MFRSLLYKETIKLKWVVISLFCFSLGLVAYIYGELGYIIRNKGEMALWDAIIYNDFVFYSKLKYFTVGVGFLLGIFQMIPEMLHKRLKLVLHLPYQFENILYTHIGIGSAFYGILTLIPTLILLLISSIDLPKEVVFSIAYTVLPWLIGGWILYIMTAFSVVEPLWKYRVANFILGLSITYTLYLDGTPSVYLNNITHFIVIPIALFPSIIISGTRFKRGIQS